MVGYVVGGVEQVIDNFIGVVEECLSWGQFGVFFLQGIQYELEVGQYLIYLVVDFYGQ